MDATTTQEERMGLIQTLDLEPIIFKLTTADGDEPPKMTLAEADHYAGLYRQFLTLNLLYPHKCIPPMRQVDEVWHAHILDTSKYRDDSDRIFGRFLDHFPYLGLRGLDDEANLEEAFAETRRLYKEHFGVVITAKLADCTGGNCCGGCGCGDDPNAPSALLDCVRPRPDRSLTTA